MFEIVEREQIVSIREYDLTGVQTCDHESDCAILLIILNVHGNICCGSN